MQFKKNVGVYAADGEMVGTVDRVVIDPGSNKVSHIVVRKGFIFRDDKVIPIEAIVSAMDDAVILKPAIRYEDLPKFEQRHYIPYHDLNQKEVQEDYQTEPLFWYPSADAGYAGYPYLSEYQPPQGEIVITRNIPSGSLPLEEGADVIDSNGKKIGSVGRIFVNNDDEITHFVISQGLFFKAEKLIPVQWVRIEGENKIHLRVSADFLENLPEFMSASS